MRTIAINELKANISRYLADAAGGQETLITRNGQPYALLAPVQAEQRERRPAIGPKSPARPAVVYLQGDRSRFSCTTQEAEQALSNAASVPAKVISLITEEGHSISFPGAAVDHVLLPSALGGQRPGPSRGITLTTLANVRFWLHENDLAAITEQIQTGTLVLRFNPYDRANEIYGPHEVCVPVMRMTSLYVGG